MIAAIIITVATAPPRALADHLICVKRGLMISAGQDQIAGLRQATPFGTVGSPPRCPREKTDTPVKSLHVPSPGTPS